MRTSTGSIWLIGLVVTFMLIFVSFLSLTISYNKVFKIKNEVLTFIEKYEGLKDGDKGSIQLINNYLTYNNYNAMHYCSVGDYGSRNLSSTNLELVSNKKEKYYYCISKKNTKQSNMPKLKDRAKYTVKFFYKLNLPVIGDILTFDVVGETIDINYPADKLQYKVQ